MGEEKRHQMMQNLFGDQSEEEEEVDSEHESNPQPNDASDEGEVGVEPEGEGEGEGEGEVEGHGEVEIESEAELQDAEPDPGESEGERDQSSQEVDVGHHREEESEGKEVDSDDREEYDQRVVTSRRHDLVESESERSEENHYVDNEDEEVDQTRSPREERDHSSLPVAEIRDVFGDSDEEDEVEYAVENDIKQDSVRSPMEEEGSFEKSPRPDDIIPDEDARYESDGRYEFEEENFEVKHKEKPVGPPLELEIPLRPPPARPEKMNMIKVSNIMGIDPKPFDPKTYEEEDVFVTDETGANKRIRLDNNIVRWRTVRKPDGTTRYESNARFVRWSDGSLQLLIGNEVLDINVQDAKHDQAHLFLRHGKGILQSQGRLMRKMRFIPSSLTSNSHRLLTALVDSRNKKVYKVKNCFTHIDPEREKEEKERAESQTIRANVLLNRKKEKVSKKYTPVIDRRRQLSPGFLEDALEEEDETEYVDSRRSRHRFEEDLEAEARAEKRIMNAKKGTRDIPRKSSLPAAKSSGRPVDFSDSEREESEYETEGEDDAHGRVEEPEHEYEEEGEENDEHDEEAEVNEVSDVDEEAEEPKHKVREYGSSHKRKGIESDEESPPRKAATHRRMAVVYDSDDE